MAGLHRSPWLWAILGAVLLALALWPAWYAGAWWRLHKVKAKIFEAGLPTTGVEVIPKPIPAEQNAAPLLVGVEKIWQALKDSEGFIKASPGANDAERNPLMFDADRLNQLQAQLQKPEVREMFRLMTEASRKPTAWFKRDYSNALRIEMDPLASLLSAVQLLCADSWLAAQKGNQKDAADDLTRLSAPVFDVIPARLAEYEVNLQLGRLGLALEDFRSREGKYPATLPDLGLPEATITDPFTGRPFIYRTERDNVLVYSVGFDREDDGGVPRASGGRRDLVWRIERDEVGHE
jgi:hypothetical protein